MKTFPDFGKELSRPFKVDERCYGCAELCHGCTARPENPDKRYAEYLHLPDLMPGTCGQTFPPLTVFHLPETPRSSAGPLTCTSAAIGRAVCQTIEGVPRFCP